MKALQIVYDDDTKELVIDIMLKLNEVIETINNVLGVKK